MSDEGEPKRRHQSPVAIAAVASVLGACFGFLIAAPAAIIVAMSARRRDV